MESANKFVQGTVWHWSNQREVKAGVQSGDRPVLVISNNRFNQHSTVVNCLTITGQIKDSPVHVAVHIERESHIQCEQSHTIPKKELTRYIGTVPPATMAMVKEKLRYQYDMSSDKSLSLLMNIKRSIDDLTAILSALDFAGIKSNLRALIDSDMSHLSDIKSDIRTLLEKADKGFGIPEIEDTFLQLMSDMYSSMSKIGAIREQPLPIEQTTPAVEEQYSADDDIDIILDESNSVEDIQPLQIEQTTPAVEGQGNRHIKYSDEDIDFILDESNTVESIMEKYGFSKRQRVHGLRHLFRKRKETEPKPVEKQPPVRSTQKYTDADKAFIIDPNNSIEAIMEKYGLERRQAVHELRYRFKKQLESTKKKRRETESKPVEKPPPVRSTQKYTDEDRAFFLDPSNSIEKIMERYGLERRQAVHELRYRFKKRLEK